MFLDKFSKRTLIKRISWMFESANLSFELLEGVSWRKVYRILKKVIKFTAINQFTKRELKEIAKLFAEGKLSDKKKADIAKLIFKIKEKYEEKEEDLIIHYSWPFLGTFFDKKQIIRC